MDRAQSLLIVVCDVLLFSIAVGLFVRRGYRSCYSFPLYIVAVLVPQTLTLLWPDTFYRLDFWLLKESLHALLKFSIALELAIRTVRAFPSAKATAQRVILVVLAAAYVGVLAATPASRDYGTEGARALLAHVLPRILNGTIWLFTAIGAVILWYRLPVAPLNKAILLGFVPYLLVFAVVTN